MTHIWVSKPTSTGSDNGLSSGRCQAIIWTNAGILLIGPLGTNLSEISAKFIYFHWRKCIWKCRLENGGHLSRPQCVKWFERIRFSRHVWYTPLSGIEETPYFTKKNAYALSNTITCCPDIFFLWKFFFGNRRLYAEVRRNDRDLNKAMSVLCFLYGYMDDRSMRNYWNYCIVSLHMMCEFVSHEIFD